MIPVRVAQLSVAQIAPSDVSFVVLLRGVEDARTLPIFIAATEAQSIAMKLNNKNFPRPLTHDLLKSVMDNMSCTLKHVEVCDLVENTFYARLVLNTGDGQAVLDSRPSDAIALALRCSAPIYVDETVMEKAGVVVEESEEGSEPTLGLEKKKAPSPLEKAKGDLQKAIEDERYEDAAVLRDEIQQLEEEQNAN